MSTMKKVGCLLCGLLMVPFAHAQTSAPLFSDAAAVGRSPSTKSSDPALQALIEEPSVKSLATVRANLGQISEDAAWLKLNLAPTLSLDVEQNYAYTTPHGAVVWSGTVGGTQQIKDRIRKFGPQELEFEPGASVLLVRNGKFLTGTVEHDGRRYSISPLHDGSHAIWEVDESRLPPDHLDDHDHVGGIDAPAMRALPRGVLQATASQDKAPRVVRVLFGFSEQARAVVADRWGLAEYTIASSNEIFANSGINIVFQLANIYRPNYNEVGGDQITDLARFREKTDGYMDRWHEWRNDESADLNVLFLKSNQICGRARINAAEHEAFSVVNYSCALNNYTMTHEVGHNFGAHHNREAGDTNIHFSYGYGYVDPDKKWRTNMAYPCTAPASCPRIKFFSSNTKTYNGKTVGNSSNNNSRVLNERAATVAGFR